MMISRKRFDLNKKCVIEKVVIKTPFRYGAIFQNEAYFLYFREGASILSAPTEKLKIQTNESILLKCGNYFADMI